MSKKNVYFFNRIKGFYRGQYSLKYFKDKFLQFNTFYLDNDFFYAEKQNLVQKWMNRIANVFLRSRAIKTSHLIWVPAMGYASTSEWNFIRKSKAGLIFDYYVSQYENLTNEFKTVEKNSPEGQQLRQTEIDFMLRSSVTLFLTAAEREYFLEYLNFDHSGIKTEIVPLVVDRRQKARLAFARGQKSIPTLAWWGTNLPLHGLKNLIHGLALAKEKGLEFKFYLVINNETRGGENEELYSLIKSLNLDQVAVYKHQFSLHDFSLESFILEEVDLCLGSFGGTRKGQTVCMNKIADAVSMNLPALTEFSNGLNEFLVDGQSVFCCQAIPEKISERLIEALSDPAKLLQMAQNLEPIYEEQFSPNAFYKRLNRIVEKVILE